MASKMSKSYKAEISGILNIEDNQITVMVEDIEEPILLSEFLQDFNDEDVKISVGYKKDM